MARLSLHAWRSTVTWNPWRTNRSSTGPTSASSCTSTTAGLVRGLKDEMDLIRSHHLGHILQLSLEVGRTEVAVR